MITIRVHSVEEQVRMIDGACPKEINQVLDIAGPTVSVVKIHKREGEEMKQE